MLENEIQKEIVRLSNLKQNKKKADSELKKQAETNIYKKEILSNFTDFVSEEEKTLIDKIIDAYLEDYKFEKSDEISKIARLVYLKVIDTRLKSQIDKEYKETKSIKMDLLEDLRENEEAIQKLEKDLGLNKGDGEQSEEARAVSELMRRYDEWLLDAENVANFTTMCPCCQEFIIIRKKLDKFTEVIKHPFIYKFKNGYFLFNKEVYELVESGKITPEEGARILAARPDYFNWVRRNYKEFLINLKNAK